MKYLFLSFILTFSTSVFAQMFWKGESKLSTKSIELSKSSKVSLNIRGEAAQKLMEYLESTVGTSKTDQIYCDDSFDVYSCSFKIGREGSFIDAL